MEFNLADLFEAVVDAVPEREALVCGGADGISVRPVERLVNLPPEGALDRPRTG